MIQIGYVQISPFFGEKERNFDQVEKLVGDKKADLLVLPELFATGYTFISKNEALSLSEPSTGITGRFLVEIAKKSGAVVVGGYIEKENDKIYNSALIVTSKGIIDSYRKIHLYYKEKLWFSPGNKPLRILNINDIKIGVMICFDWIFPETVRSLALLGAEIIAHPANLVLPYCQKAMITRCLENRVFAVTSNRVGEEARGNDHFKFTGKSQITSFNGEVLSSAPIDENFIDVVEIDLNFARNKKLNEYNDLFKDRRKDFYFND